MDVGSFLLRATIFLLGASALSWGLRRGAAGTRHVLWTGSFVALLGLPVVVLAGVGWDLPILPSENRLNAPILLPAPIVTTGTTSTTHPRSTSSETPRALSPRATSNGATRSTPATTVTSNRGFPWTSALLGLWALGTVAMLVSLLVGARRLRARVRGAQRLEDPDWADQMSRLKCELDLRRDVRLLTSAETDTPMTSGWRRPVILLPPSATTWSAERRRVVLLHELIHVRRGDAPRQILARLALGLYWFHPLSWVASRMARASREQACDETVLSLGTRPSDYASHLLELAESIRPSPAVLALPIVQRSMLEKRIMAILQPHPVRGSRITSVSVLLAVAALGVSAATARPVPTTSQAAVVPTPPAEIAAAPASGWVADTPAPIPDAPEPPLAPVRTTASLAQDITCRMEGQSGTFRGSLSSSRGRVEQSGWRDGDRTIQRYADGLRLCMRIHGEVLMADDGLSVRAVGDGSWVVLESEEDALRRLVITEASGGIEYAWTVDGRGEQFGTEARAWRDRMFEVLGGYWEASRIRGEQSSLRGRISSHRGRISTLRGQISTHRGHVSSLRGQMSSHRGRVSSLKGQISSRRGHISSLRGETSSLRARMSSLNSAIRATSDSDTRARLEDETRAYEDKIRDVQRAIEAYDLDGQVAEIEEEIANFGLEEREREIANRIEAYDLDAKVADIEQEIEAYDLDGKVRDIDREIEALDADRRAEAIERETESKVAALRRLIRGL